MDSREYKDERPLKKVEDTKVDWLKTVQYEDINPYQRLFGGRLISWMDEIAGIVATRHSGGVITTAAIDNLQFLKGAVIGDLIAIEARLTYVGRTSMEVRVDVYREDRKTGLRYPINRAYFTEVAIDEQGNPEEVPYGLAIETEAQRADYEGALRRIEVRKMRRKEGF